MLLKEITYSILELLRKGSIVDDEPLDIRLIEFFVRSKRAEYVQSIVDKGVPLGEQFYQYIETDVTKDSEPNQLILKTTDSFPKVISNREGNTIKEVASLDLIQYIFTLVNNNRFRYSGNGRFNSNIIYVTYRDNTLYFTSSSKIHLHLTTILVKTVLEDPKDDESFDEETNEYPISLQCYEYIKEAIMKEDIKMFMSGIPDTENNSTFN